MNRRSFLKSAALGVADLVLPGCIGTMVKSWGGRPDVLFIAIDDMNDWTTLFNPKNPIKTPNLLRLAKRGMFFSKAYCAAPACTPSRTAILTGYRPTTSGSYKNDDFLRDVAPDAVTLPDYFRKSGYSAKGAGKIFTHFNGAMGGDPAGKSFDDFQPMQQTRGPRKNYNGYTEKEAPLNETCFDWGQHIQKMIDIDMVEYIEKVMEQKRDKPMFLAAGIFKPHLPFYAPPETFQKYTFDETIFPKIKKNDLDDVPEIGKEMAHTEHFIYSNTTAKPDNDPGSLKKMIQCYQASADFADQMVGRLIDKLDETGRADNTIIVLWADHGYHLGDKESCVKFTLWEKANHVPFIIVAPKVTKPGSRCDRPVSLLDIYPTLVELAGLPQKQDLDGKSLVPLLRNPTQKWHPALMTWGKGNHAVRSDRWRYIRYSDGSQELYDHSRDPWEWTNLATVPEYAQVMKEHEKWLPANEK
ncbi:MAG TPA: sulfatase-like hydrolase/transferase [Planctomycetes bacterium]|nr:sulfatase-like hydrolase/transferase [Planctomycetota bacterium]